MLLRYTLTDGSVVTRSYRIPLTQEALDDPDTPAARLDALLNAPGQAEKAYFGAMAEGDYLISAVVTQPHYDEEGAYYYDEKPVDSAGLEELWSAVQADLADGSLGRRYLLENQARGELLRQRPDPHLPPGGPGRPRRRQRHLLRHRHPPDHRRPHPGRPGAVRL